MGHSKFITEKWMILCRNFVDVKKIQELDKIMKFFKRKINYYRLSLLAYFGQRQKQSSVCFSLKIPS